MRRTSAIAITALAAAVTGVSVGILTSRPSTPKTEIQLTGEAPPPPMCSRLVPEDLAELPPGACAALGTWFQTSAPAPKTVATPDMTLDPYFSTAGLRFVNEFGAIPDDALDDTVAIQAALTSCHEAHVHCFLIARPGTYLIETLNGSRKYGWTFWGYNGVVLKRHDFSYYQAKYPDDPVGAAEWSVMLTGIPYRPYLAYKCAVNEPCEPMRVLGMTLDGNPPTEILEENRYALQHAHLIYAGAEGATGVVSPVEVRDTTLRNGPADGIALNINNDAVIERVECYDVARGCVTHLGAQNRIKIRDLYATGGAIIRAWDLEPQGISQGPDFVTGETGQSARLYFDAERVVLGGGVDFWTPKGGSPETLVGGTMTLRRVYQLQPSTYIKTFEGDLTISDSYFHVAGLSSAIARDEGSRGVYDFNGVRESKHVELDNVWFKLAVPSDAEIASAFALKPIKNFYITAFTVQLTNNTNPWPGHVTLNDVIFDVEDPTRELPANVVLEAIRLRGDAQQGHTLEINGGVISSAYDVGLRQEHGGILTVRGLLAGAPLLLCDFAHPAGIYAYTAVDDVVLAPGSVVPAVCPNHSEASSFAWTIAAPDAGMTDAEALDSHGGDDP